MPLDKVRSVFRSAARAEHYVKNHEALEASLEMVNRAYLGAVAAGARDQIVVLNVSYFATLYNYDLTVLLEDLDSAPTDWHERLYGRVLCSVPQFDEALWER